MTYPLHIELVDEMYVLLLKAAERIGQTPERLAAQWLSNDIQRLRADPLEPFIGAFQSHVTGWPERHDDYLGKAALEQLPNETIEGEAHGRSVC